MAAVDPITGIALVDWALSLLDSWGYLLVFAFTVLENVFVVGSFTPGETVVMAAAFLATPGQGHLQLWMVWTASVVGTVLGSNISYIIGRRGGRDTLLRFGRRFWISEQRINEAEEYFYHYGSKTVFMSRFAAGFKNFVPMIAGVSKMHVAYFEGWTFLGAVSYTSVMCAIGWFVGENLDRALAVAGRLGLAGIVLFVIVIGGAIIGRRTFKFRRSRSAEPAEDTGASADADPDADSGEDS